MACPRLECSSGSRDERLTLAMSPCGWGLSDFESFRALVAMVVPIGRHPMLKVVNFEELVEKEEPRGKSMLPECERDLQEVGGVKVNEALAGSVES